MSNPDTPDGPDTPESPDNPMRLWPVLAAVVGLGILAAVVVYFVADAEGDDDDDEDATATATETVEETPEVTETETPAETETATETPEETETETPEETETATETPEEDDEDDDDDEDDEEGEDYEPDDCPLDDEDVCAFAVMVANALIDGDEGTIVDLSIEQTLEEQGEFQLSYDDATCAEGGEVLLTGYHINLGHEGFFALLSEPEYDCYVGLRLDAVDPDASDEFGDGALEVYAIADCNQGFASRTDFQLAATAISPDDGRVFMVVSFDTYDGDLAIDSFVYLTLEGIEAFGLSQGDPANDILCAPAQPWGA
jgi:hypothetical protein